MAKGNGGTRGNNPRSMYGGNSDNGLTPARFEGYVNDLASKVYPAGWDDLDFDRRELALMESGFTGLADDGAENIMFEQTKDWAIDEAVSAIVNEQSYGPDADKLITIGYLDGSQKEIGGLGMTVELSKPMTRNQSYKTQEGIAKSSLNTKNIGYIIVNDASGSYYWSSEKGAPSLRNYTGMEKWTNGRGEKRRDYIQDDWI